MPKKDPVATEAVVVAETTEVEATPILDAFNAAVTGSKKEDDIKMDMIGAGATFKNVTRLFNQYMVDTGQAMSKEDKTTLLDENLKEADLSTEEGFKAATAVVVEKGNNVTEGSAAGLVRAWAKKAEVECYKAPASEGTRNPFIPNFHAAMIANPQLDEAGLKKVIADLPEDEQRVNPLRHFNHHNSIRKMVNKAYAKWANVEEASEDEAEAA